MIITDRKAGTVKLCQKGVVFIGHDELDMIDIGFWSAANLISTIMNNVNAVEKVDRFFQRSCWTFKLDIANRKIFQAKMLEFLEESHEKAKDRISPFEELAEKSNQITAGISMYYFEDMPST